MPQGQRAIYYWDMEMRKGLSVLHIKNNFVSNFTYDFPKLGMTGFGGAVLNGWQVNSVITMASGHPLTPLDPNTVQRNLMGYNEALRPNLIPGGNNNPVLGGPERYFDTSQFVPSTCVGGRLCRPGDPDYQTGYFGNLGLLTVIGPGLMTVDFSVNKKVRFSEEKQLQFRAEFFNLFNQVNFGAPDMNVFLGNGNRNPNAGTISRTRTKAREIQFGLKFIF